MPNMNSTENLDIITKTVSLFSSFQFWGGISDACQRNWCLISIGESGILKFKSTAVQPWQSGSRRLGTDYSTVTVPGGHQYPLIKHLAD